MKRHIKLRYCTLFFTMVSVTLGPLCGSALGSIWCIDIDPSNQLDGMSTSSTSRSPVFDSTAGKGIFSSIRPYSVLWNDVSQSCDSDRYKFGALWGIGVGTICAVCIMGLEAALLSSHRQYLV